MGLLRRGHDTGNAEAVKPLSSSDPLPLFELDFNALRKHPGLGPEIEQQEKYFASMKSDLDKDESYFRDKAEAILLEPKPAR